MLRASLTSPSLPSRMYWIAEFHAPPERFCVPAWQIRPSLRAAWTMRRPSLTLWLTGFST